jgi:hypothetical protein
MSCDFFISHDLPERAVQATRGLDVNSTEQKNNALSALFHTECWDQKWLLLIVGFLTLGIGAVGYACYIHHRATMAMKDALANRKLEQLPTLRAEIERLSSLQENSSDPEEKIKNILGSLQGNSDFKCTFKKSELKLLTRFHDQFVEDRDVNASSYDYWKGQKNRIRVDAFKQSLENVNEEDFRAFYSYVKDRLRHPLTPELKETLFKITTHPLFHEILKKPDLYKEFTAEQRQFFAAFQMYQVELAAKIEGIALEKYIPNFEAELQKTFAQDLLDKAKIEARKKVSLSEDGLVLPVADQSSDNVSVNEIFALLNLIVDAGRTAGPTTFYKHHLDGCTSTSTVEHNSLFSLLQHFRSMFLHHENFDLSLNQNLQAAWYQRLLLQLVSPFFMALQDLFGNTIILGERGRALYQEFHEYEGQNKVRHICHVSLPLMNKEYDKSKGHLYFTYEFIHQKTSDEWHVEGPFITDIKVEMTSVPKFVDS